MCQQWKEVCRTEEAVFKKKEALLKEKLPR
jgi:hypothetical protein